MTNTQDLPRADASERALAGAAVFAPAIVDEFRDITLAMFADDTFGQIFEAVRDLRDAGKPIDNKIVITEMQRRKIDLKGVIEEIIDCGTLQVPHVAYHAKLVRDSHQRREIIKAAQAAIAEASDSLADVQAVSATAIARLESFGVQSTNHTFDGEEVSGQLYQETFGEITKPRCIKTGFPLIDNKLGGGLYRGQSIILAAKTGGGKTTAAMNIAENVAAAGQTVLFVSFEMDGCELAKRIIARKTGLTIEQQERSKGQNAKLMKQGLAHVATLGKSLNFHTPPASTVSSIRAEARLIAARGSLDLIVVDYLQQLSAEGRLANQNAAVTQISRALKVMAGELEVPVLTLSQLNRSIGDDTPQLHHLRDSGSIEQDANMVFFLHHNDESQPCSRQFIIAKNRNGPKCQLNLSYDAPRFLFEDPSTPTDWTA